jgi:hypothetical protein
MRCSTIGWSRFRMLTMSALRAGRTMYALTRPA